MTDGVFVNFDDLKEPVALFSGMAANLSNMTPAMAEVAITLKSQVGRTFARAADPVTGASWRGLSRLTSGNRRGGGGGAKPLRDTGRLLQSLIASNPVVTPNQASISTNVIYARIQNDGGVVSPVNSKYLAIPLNPEAAKSGGARRFFDKLKTTPGRVKRIRWPVMGVYNTTTKKFTPMFLLLSSVSIPRRRYLGYSAAYANEIIDIVNAYGFNLPILKAMPGPVDGPSGGAR